MESIVFKVGELVTHSLCELAQTKNINPIFIEIDDNRKTKTIEFSNGLLTSTIPQAISKLEEANGLCAAIILPVEIKENNTLYKAILAVIHNFEKDYDITISIKYNFDEDDIQIGKYELIEYNNLFETELKEIENEFVKGLLTPKTACDIWLKGA